MRFDVIIDKTNTPTHIVDWLEDKYSNHNGTKANFLRRLLMDLYNQEEKKEDVLKYLMDNIEGISRNQEKKESINKNDMDDILNQF